MRAEGRCVTERMPRGATVLSLGLQGFTKPGQRWLERPRCRRASGLFGAIVKPERPIEVNKVLATLVAGLFAAGAFAIAPVAVAPPPAPAAVAATTTTAAPAAAASVSASAKAEAKAKETAEVKAEKKVEKTVELKAEKKAEEAKK